MNSKLKIQKKVGIWIVFSLQGVLDYLVPFCRMLGGAKAQLCQASAPQIFQVSKQKINV